MAPIVGVSKRCCVVCDKLFSILYKNYPDKLDRPPPHQITFTCALPDHLPKGVVNAMLEALKEMLLAVLKKEVLKQVVATKAPRRSIDSHHSQGGDSDTASDTGYTLWRKDHEDTEEEFVVVGSEGIVVMDG